MALNYDTPCRVNAVAWHKHTAKELRLDDLSSYSTLPRAPRCWSDSNRFYKNWPEFPPFSTNIRTAQMHSLDPPQHHHYEAFGFD